MRNKACLIVVLMLMVLCGRAQNTLIKGVVTDSITGEALPYVSVLLEGTTIGSTTDNGGKFTISTSSKARRLLVSYLGYAEKTLDINPGKTNTLVIRLAPSSINLSEVLVKPKKERYTKKENPAVAFVRKVIEARESNDPRNQDYFRYDQYEKMVFAMNDFQPKPRKETGKAGKLDFLVDYIDTLELGRTILPVSEKEKFETVCYRKEPKSEKRLVKGMKSSGIDDLFSRDGIQQFLGEVFREVDIFKNDIPLFLNRFVSPLSTIGPSFYKYYLLDTVVINNQRCVDLGFVPFTSETFGFTGHLYVTLDSTYFVQRAILNVPKDINLNFVSGMSIEQTFVRTPDGTRLITKDDINVDFKLSEKSKGLYARRVSIYNNHSFDAPADELVFKEAAPVVTLKEAYTQTDDFWANNRPAEVGKRNENTVEKLMAKLRSIPIFYVTEKVVSILVSGYIPTNIDPLKSKFEFGPMNTSVSANAVEGARFRVGGTTTTALSKHLFMDGYVAYGTKDGKLKYNAGLEYSFNEKKEYQTEFPVNSIRAEYSYDVNQLGQQYMYTNKDNLFLSWKRQKDTRMTYLRNAELTYYREHYNGIAYGATVRNRREYATEYVAFNRIDAGGAITSLKDYSMSELELKFRYAPNEKFYQTRNFRYAVTQDAPVFTLNQIVAKEGLLGSSYNYNRTEIGMQKRFWFSAFGYLDILGKGGKVWNKVPYPLLILPNANLSYTVQPESYTCMNAMEFINDEYLSWDVTYFMNGLLLNRIPLIKKLKWREVLSFRGLYGHLTDKNNPMLPDSEGLYQFPAGSYAMGNTPYMEVGAGIENIFKFLRLDYVWRLTYRDHPNIQTKGVRFSMHLTF